MQGVKLDPFGLFTFKNKGYEKVGGSMGVSLESGPDGELKSSMSSHKFEPDFDNAKIFGFNSRVEADEIAQTIAKYYEGLSAASGKQVKFSLIGTASEANAPGSNMPQIYVGMNTRLISPIGQFYQDAAEFNISGAGPVEAPLNSEVIASLRGASQHFIGAISAGEKTEKEIASIGATVNTYREAHKLAQEQGYTSARAYFSGPATADSYKSGQLSMQQKLVRVISGIDKEDAGVYQFVAVKEERSGDLVKEREVCLVEASTSDSQFYKESSVLFLHAFPVIAGFVVFGAKLKRARRNYVDPKTGETLVSPSDDDLKAVESGAGSIAQKISYIFYKRFLKDNPDLAKSRRPTIRTNNPRGIAKIIIGSGLLSALTFVIGSSSTGDVSKLESPVKAYAPFEPKNCDPGAQVVLSVDSSQLKTVNAVIKKGQRKPQDQAVTGARG